MASETDTGRYLIHKAGRGWYRPDAQGYTLDPRQAGRYSFDEAVAHSHPNGPFGPRDGIVVKNENEVYGACPDTPVVTRPAPEYAGLVERLAGMEPLDTAPRDRTHILAKTLPRDDQWSNYGGRWFVVWHIDKVSGWSLFPGMGVGDDWFEGWVRLPLAAATALTALTERNKALEAEVERLRGGTGDTSSNMPIVRPSQPDNDSVWYRGWEAGYDDTAARYVKECWVAYEGGCDLDAPSITASSWDDLLDEIDAALGDRP